MGTGHIVALVVAAGTSERAGGATPKQFALLGGKPVLRWSVDALAAHPRIDRVIVAVAPSQVDRAQSVVSDMVAVTIIAGGETRRASVAAALAVASEAKVVLVHDAARPILSSAMIDAVMAPLALGAAGVVPALPVTDTVAGRARDRLGPVTDRSALVRVQTPQGFQAAALREAHERWSGAEPTDDAQMVRALGLEVKTVTGDAALAKITFAEDFAMAEALLGLRIRTAVGMGYDVHRLVAGEELWLGGIRVEHDFGLSGHSDADVALHALTDAILGAIGAGDIGDHFPPSDSQWRGARSDQFLAHAVQMVAMRGGTVTSVDVTIICEAPRIGPLREAMRSRIAEILGIAVDRVSVKATTTERLGFTGRGEGIAAQAVATLSIMDQ